MEAETIMRAATWLGGPWDGKRVLVDPSMTEYAVGYKETGEVVDYPKMQRFLSDPAYWLKDRKRVATVRIYPVEWTDDEPTIRWHEKKYRIIEIGA